MPEKVRKKFSDFAESGWYLVLLGALTVGFWCAGRAAGGRPSTASLTLSLVGMGLNALLAAAVLVCRRDLTPVLANIILIPYINSYYALTPKGFLILLAAVGPIVVAAAVAHGLLWYRRRPPEEPFRFRTGRLFWSFLAVVVTATLGGLGCSFYDYRNLPLIFAEALGFLACYLFAVNFTSADPKFVMRVLFALGISVGLQLVFYYLSDGGNFFDKLFAREYTDFGWSNCVNEASNVLFFCVPAAFYLAAKSKYSPLYLCGAMLMAVNGLFMISRGNILIGAIVLVPLCGYLLLRAEYRGRTAAAVFLCVALAAALGGLFYDKWSFVFSRLITFGDGSGRLPLWENAAEWIRRYPVFGVGYYGENPEILASDFSGAIYKVHNSVLQVLLCSGVVGFAAIVFHYAQKILLFRRAGTFSLFAAGSVLIIEGYGLMDLTMTTGFIMLVFYILLAAVEKQGAPVPLPTLREIPKKCAALAGADPDRRRGRGEKRR